MAERKRVLVVDDMPLFRRSMAELLEMYGFQAIQANSLPQALALIEAIASLDGLLSDGNLTEKSEDGKDGEIVAQAFRNKFPGKPVLSISSTRGLSWSDVPGISADSDVEDIVTVLNGSQPE